jgi:hypothetical protein
MRYATRKGKFYVIDEGVRTQITRDEYIAGTTTVEEETIVVVDDPSEEVTQQIYEETDPLEQLSSLSQVSEEHMG